MNIKNCPICNSVPSTKKEHMGWGNGRGYWGNYSFNISCSKCKLMPSGSSDDIYESSEGLEKRAITSWNKEVNKVYKMIKKTYNLTEIER